MTEKKVKASEKLMALEKAFLKSTEDMFSTKKRVGELELLAYELSRENDLMSQIIKVMNQKQNAVVGLIRKGQELSDENINNEIAELNVIELKKKIDNALEDGNIEPGDVIQENSLVIAREIDKEGKVQNPRVQFVVATLKEAQREKFVGKKAGDLIETEGDKWSVEITEVYEFVEKELESKEREAEVAPPVAEEVAEATE